MECRASLLENGSIIVSLSNLSEYESGKTEQPAPGKGSSQHQNGLLKLPVLIVTAIPSNTERTQQAMR
jgi:hypothetical protein